VYETLQMNNLCNVDVRHSIFYSTFCSTFVHAGIYEQDDSIDSDTQKSPTMHVTLQEAKNGRVYGLAVATGMSQFVCSHVVIETLVQFLKNVVGGIP